MVIDADTHVTDRKGGINTSADRLLAELDRFGIDRAVCWPMVSYEREVADDNRTIAAAAKSHPDRIIGFGGLNPMKGLQVAKDELMRCADQYGMKGIKFNGARDGYCIDSKELALPLIEEVVSRHMILAFHSGMNDPASTHPWRIANIAKALPQATIIMVHMGGVGMSPALHQEAIQVAQEHPRVYLAASEASPVWIEKAIRALGAERVFFASDAPFVPMKYGWAMFQALLEDFSERERRLVMGDAAAKVLAV